MLTKILEHKRTSLWKERLRAKTKIVRHQEAKLRHEEGSVKLREESVSDKLLTLERRTKVNYYVTVKGCRDVFF